MPYHDVSFCAFICYRMPMLRPDSHSRDSIEARLTQFTDDVFDSFDLALVIEERTKALFLSFARSRANNVVDRRFGRKEQQLEDLEIERAKLSDRKRNVAAFLQDVCTLGGDLVVESAVDEPIEPIGLYWDGEIEPSQVTGRIGDVADIHLLTGVTEVMTTNGLCRVTFGTVNYGGLDEQGRNVPFMEQRVRLGFQPAGEEPVIWHPNQAW